MFRISLLLVTLLLLTTVFDVEAQRRTTYENLLQRTDQPSSYIDHVVIPTSDSTAVFSVFFRLDHDLISFLRKRPEMSAPAPDAEYFAPLRMGVEIFEGRVPESRRSRHTPVSAFRDSWQDTVWVNSYEETKSRFDHVQGVLSNEFSNGDYHYELQFTRGGSIREQSSSRRNFKIPEYASWEEASIILLSGLTETDQKLEASLLNYGSNVLYGQDYHLLIALPASGNVEAESFTLNIHRLQGGEGSDVSGDAVFSSEFTDENFIYLSDPDVRKEDGFMKMEFNRSDSGVRFVHIEVPNREFENARYKISLSADGVEKPLAERTINSQWLDMPVSLYNLDVAINMLRFIVSDSELRRINSGSSSERERKFREFWAQRDPTPDTEFNELMAEYYARIDHTFNNFSSLQTPGYETDQGKAYILYGEPINVSRQLPRDAPTREIWEYRDRTLIFEATTGFGDFRLISES